MKRTFLVMPETASVLLPHFLRSLMFLPPTFTTLHWSYPLTLHLPERTTMTGALIPCQWWCGGFLVHGTSLQPLMVLIKPILGHPVANLFQHWLQLLWISGMLLPLKNAPAYTSPVLFLMSRNYMNIHQIYLPTHQMDILWLVALVLLLPSGISRQVEWPKRLDTLEKALSLWY